MKAYYHYLAGFIIALCLYSSFCFAIPPRLKHVSITICSSNFSESRQWQLVPMVEKDHTPSIHNLSLDIGEYNQEERGHYASIPAARPLRFMLTHQSTPESTLEHHNLVFTWDDYKGYQLNAEYSRITLPGQPFNVRAHYQPLEPVVSDALTGTGTEAVLADYQSGLLMLSFDNTQATTTHKTVQKTGEEKGTDEIDGSFFTPPQFKVTLINDASDVIASQTAFSMHSVRMWPDYIDEATRGISKDSRVPTFKKLHHIRGEQSRLALSHSDDPSAHNAIYPQTSVTGDTSKAAQLFSRGNEISVIIEQIRQEGQGPERRQEATQYGYLKLRVKGEKATVVGGDAARFIDSYTVYTEKKEKQSITTLALKMKHSDEIPSAALSQNTSLQGTTQQEDTDTVDGPAACSQQSSLFPQTLEDAAKYIEQVHQAFSKREVF